MYPTNPDWTSPLDTWCKVHDVPKEVKEDLRFLKEQERLVYIIADDSSSMNSRDVKSDSGSARKRWTEACETLGEMCDLAMCVTKEDLSLVLLNDMEGEIVRYTDVHSILDRLHAVTPTNGTPLSLRLKSALDQIGDRPAVIAIFTDGEPDDVQEFVHLLRGKPETVAVSIFACTDDESAVAWLNDLDHQIRGVDVMDDYHSERIEVLRRDPRKSFTRGEYVAKGVLGSVFAKWDQLDETRCCVML